MLEGNITFPLFLQDGSSLELSVMSQPSSRALASGGGWDGSLLNDRSPSRSLETSRDARNHICLLPVEILSIIFQSVDPRGGCEVDLPAPFHFPFNLAGVCCLWHDILSAFPWYWTNLVIFVDPVQLTPLSDLQLFLSYSKNLPLKITVTRIEVEAGPTPHDLMLRLSGDDEEQQRTRAVIDILQPHFSRCTFIRFDLIYGSSLPSFETDLLPLSKNLYHLELKCFEDDEHPAPICIQDLWKNYPYPPMTNMPRLQTFRIAGKAIVDAIAHAPYLFILVKETIELMNFKICSIEAAEDFLPYLFGIFSTSSTSRRITSLTLNDVDIPFYEGNQEERVQWNIGTLSLKNMENSDILSNLFTHVNFIELEFLFVENCRLDAETPPFPSLSFLDLTKVHGSLHSILDSDPTELYLDNCPGFDDFLIIDLLSRRAKGRNYWLRKLYTRNCLNFSIGPILELANSKVSGRQVQGINYPERWLDDICVDAMAPKLRHCDRMLLGQEFRPKVSWSSQHGSVRQESDFVYVSPYASDNDSEDGIY